MQVKQNKLHTPVLLEEVLNIMKEHTEVVVDATCGTAGHAYTIASTYKNSIKTLYCFEKDPVSMEIAKDRLKEFAFVRFINESYTQIADVLTKDAKEADFILFDLGLSMWQISSSQRGFSFKSEEILDMRFNPNKGIPVFELLQKIGPEDLSKIFETYGDVKNAKKIASLIVRERKRKKIRTTKDLVEILNTQHISSKEIQKIFMSLRIYINNELLELANGISNALSITKKNGILAFITYHSIEDRIVKKLSNVHKVMKIKPYPIKPSIEEIKSNHRARSAKLRAFIKGGDYVEETAYSIFNTVGNSFLPPVFGT